jgi:hypothetical protein
MHRGVNIFLSKFALGFMLYQLIESKCFLAAFVLISAIVLNFFDHIKQNWINIDEFSLWEMTIWAFTFMCKPTCNAVRTEQLVLTIATFHWLSLFMDYLVTNSTIDIFLDIKYAAFILDSTITYKEIRTHI